MEFPACYFFCQRQLVVYFFHRPQQPLPLALLAEGMLCGITVTDSFPCPPVPTAYSRVAVVLLIAAVLLLPMLLTKPPLCQLGTAGEGTRSLRFPWHLPHLRGLNRYFPTAPLHKLWDSPHRLSTGCHIYKILLSYAFYSNICLIPLLITFHLYDARNPL